MRSHIHEDCQLWNNGFLPAQIKLGNVSFYHKKLSDIFHFHILFYFLNTSNQGFSRSLCFCKCILLNVSSLQTCEKNCIVVIKNACVKKKAQKPSPRRSTLQMYFPRIHRNLSLLHWDKKIFQAVSLHKKVLIRKGWSDTDSKISHSLVQEIVILKEKCVKSLILLLTAAWDCSKLE